jgi:hypothetical protein
MPPKHRHDGQNGGRNHDEDQSRIFDPRDGRNAKGHDQSQKADCIAPPVGGIQLSRCE